MSWRLSKIEEEIDHIHVKTGTQGQKELPNHIPIDRDKLLEVDAVRQITEKYDSLPRVRASRPPDSLSSPVSGGGFTPESPRSPVSAWSPGYPGSRDLLPGPRMSVGTSDAASDISDVPPSSASTVSSDGLSSPLVHDRVTEADVSQVEMFYRSHKTNVYVCACLANLYFGSSRTNVESNWDLAATGIPVLVLDTGEHSRKRRLYFILAEKGTGFVLWRDVIDSLTKYTAPHTNFHTLHLSTDHTKLAGLSFDDTSSASEFHGIVNNLTSDPDDELLCLSSRTKKTKRKDKVKMKKAKPPRKSEISQPCCFVHVTKLERPAIGGLLSINDVTSPDMTSQDMTSQDMTSQDMTSQDMTSQEVDEDVEKDSDDGLLESPLSDQT